MSLRFLLMMSGSYFRADICVLALKTHDVRLIASVSAKKVVLDIIVIRRCDWAALDSRKAPIRHFVNISRSVFFDGAIILPTIPRQQHQQSVHFLDCC